MTDSISVRIDTPLVSIELNAPIRPDGASAHALEEIVAAAVTAYRNTAADAAKYAVADGDEDDDTDGD